jgi:thiamine-phosphate pyrophosphorylase
VASWPKVPDLGRLQAALDSRLYAILDFDRLLSRRLSPDVVAKAWLAAGVRLIQLRAKSLTSGRMLELADELAGLARAAGAVFIVNDRADVARLAGADGVHVGQEDLSPGQVRGLVGTAAFVGVSTHTLAQATTAAGSGADYLGFGPVFPTTSKERPDRVVGLAGVTAVSHVSQAASRPLVAIGGITEQNAAAVISAGASAVAVIADLVSEDPETRARALLAALR